MCCWVGKGKEAGGRNAPGPVARVRNYRLWHAGLGFGAAKCKQQLRVGYAAVVRRVWLCSPGQTPVRGGVTTHTDLMSNPPQGWALRVARGGVAGVVRGRVTPFLACPWHAACMWPLALSWRSHASQRRTGGSTHGGRIRPCAQEEPARCVLFSCFNIDRSPPHSRDLPGAKLTTGP